MDAAAAVRRFWRLPVVCLWILAGLGLAVVQGLVALSLPSVSERTRSGLTRLWMRGLIAILPLRVCYHGVPTAAAALWTSNHVSWIDIVVLGARTPLRFLSKAEVASWPAIGRLATAAGTLYLHRGQGMAGVLDLQIGEALERGQSVVIFAEGTTTDGSGVRTFHGRLLASALRTGRPVQPVAIAYRCDGQRDQTAPFIANDEFTQHLWRLLGRPVIDVDVTFPPALPSAGSNRNQLARRAQESVAQALGLGTRELSTMAIA